jgi:hypothetical protein
MSHDQNFKNLILDYPLAAVSFFAEAEASGVDAGVRLMPIRQEQLQERLGDRHRYLEFRYLACALFQREASAYFESHNIVARLNHAEHGL